MKISIITPCLNNVTTIKKTIESVISEKKNSEIEYIIVDGKSSDGTLNIIRDYEKYLDVLISEEDAGLYDAFNKGVKLATGDYILILAADDYLLEGGIQRFKDSILPETQVWCGATVIFYEGYFQYMYSEKDLQNLKYRCSLRHPATFFERNLYDLYGYYNTEYKIAADREFFLRLWRNNVIFQIEDIPIVYFSVDGISNTKLEEIGIPEEKRISVQYGLTNGEVKEYYNKTIAYRVKKRLRSITVLTRTYRILCRITGRGKKFLSKNEINDLGLE